MELSFEPQLPLPRTVPKLTTTEHDRLFTLVTAVTLLATQLSAHLVAPGQKQNLCVWVFGGGRHFHHDGLHHDRHAVGEVLGRVTFKYTGGKRKKDVWVYSRWVHNHNVARLPQETTWNQITSVFMLLKPSPLLGVGLINTHVI